MIGPSNPVISIGPILALPGMRDALRDAAAPVVAVSPFVGGRAVKGPTEPFMEHAGLPLGPAGVAEAYGDVLDGIVSDEPLEGASVPVLVTDTRDGRRPRATPRRHGDPGVCGEPVGARTLCGGGSAVESRSEGVRHLRTLAIVPVKSFYEAKQRLAESLARGSRSSLAQAMFSDVLAALGRVRGIESIVVVTADPAAQQLAHGRALVLHDSVQSGQSDATLIGIRHATATGADRVLLVPGDTPLIDPLEVDLLLKAAEREALATAIVADRHRTGTNALVLTPPDSITPAFGPDSLDRHRRLARDADIEHRVVHVASLEHDVDTPEDLAALREALDGVRGRAQRTKGALHQIDHARARPPAVAVEVQA